MPFLRLIPLQGPFYFRGIVEVPGADGVIVGINNPDYGRSCDQHLICGEEVKVGSIISFQLTEMSVEGEIELVIMVIMDGCHVGWVPRYDVNRFLYETNERKALVTGLLNNKALYNKDIRRMYYQNYGAASFTYNLVQTCQNNAQQT